MAPEIETHVLYKDGRALVSYLHPDGYQGRIDFSSKSSLTIISHAEGLDGECSIQIQNGKRNKTQQFKPNTYEIFPSKDVSIAIVHGSPLQDVDKNKINQRLAKIQLEAIRNPLEAKKMISAWKEEMEKTYQANPAAHVYALIRLMQLSLQSTQSR